MALATSESMLTRSFSRIPKTFAGLAKHWRPRLIETACEYDQVVDMIDALIGRELTCEQADYLAILTLCVERYEAELKISCISEVDDSSQIIRHLCDEQGMKPIDLGRLLGQPSVGSKLFRGERKPSKEHARKMAEHFGVPVGLFV